MRERFLGVDIDDVLSNYTEEFVCFLRERGMEISKRDIRGSFVEMKLDDHMREFHESGRMESLQVIEGARNGMEELDKHFYIVIITNRIEAARDITRKWYDGNFRPAPIIHTPDKVATCKNLNVFGLIDDQLRWLENVKPSFAIAHEWNDGFSGFRGEWPQVVEHILSLKGG